jgi:hypothetical protein
MELPEGYVAPAPQEITVHAGEQLTGQDIVFVHGGLLTGRVVEAATGEPVVGGGVSATLVTLSAGKVIGRMGSSQWGTQT